MRKTLFIVQNKPTQFDAPLYAYIEQQRAFRLQVYYTETHLLTVAFDAEIERQPVWDHLGDGGYERCDLTSDEAGNAAAVAAMIAAQRPDLVILAGYFPKLHRQLLWPLKRRGIRVGLRSDNTLPHSDFSGLKGALKHLLLPFWLRLYDTWHPVGSLAEQYLCALTGTARPTFLFPYNVDNQWLGETAARYREQRSALRAAYGWGESDFVVLGIMKWHEREDPLTLVEAFTHFHVRQPNARLLLVGDGPLRGVLRQKTAAFGDSIVLPGYVAYSELPRYYALSDVFVHPAVNEPWGVSVNEAMACGLPVITAKGVGAAVDLIVDGVTGFTFPNRNSAQLAEYLTLFAADRSRCGMMGGSAAQHVEAWSYRQTFDEMRKALACC